MLSYTEQILTTECNDCVEQFSSFRKSSAKHLLIKSSNCRGGYKECSVRMGNNAHYSYANHFSNNSDHTWSGNVFNKDGYRKAESEKERIGQKETGA